MKKLATTDHTIIGIGASAGGLEALEHMFRNLEPSTKVSYVVVQHLSPDYKSMMVELLSKHTSLPIQQASDNQKVLPGNIYLIPPKKNIRLKNGHLVLEDIHSAPGNLNLPIDNFFISLAEEQGEKAIGIILSGTGSDGTRGIRRIKEKGGLVIVQDEKEAKFDGMPRSAIATGLVDYILSVEKIGSVIQKFIEHPLIVKEIDPLPQEDEDSYDTILALIKKQSGIDFSNYKSATVVRRIARRMSLNQIESLRDYRQYLELNPREVNILERELLIGVTCFFRDSEAFEFLKKEAFPKIFSRKQKKDQVRFWVTACSTGEEAYSLAIIAKEFMRENNTRYDLKIFATDVDPYALKTAGTGSYTDSIAADISEERLRNFFIKKGNIYQINPEIREMVIFAPQNIIKDPPFSRIDLISCRNFLIYLQPEVQKKILQMFHFSLLTGGILFLGTSESLGDLSPYFSELHSKWKIFQSKPGNLSYSPGTLNSETPTYTYRSIYTNSILNRNLREEKILDKLFTNILEKYLPPCAVVNDNNQIIHVVGNINPYVKMQSGKVNFDITNMVDKSIRIALSTGLRKCFLENKEVVYKNISLQEDYYRRILNLIIQPIASEGNEPKLAVVIFEEVHTGNLKLPASDSSSKEYNFDENMHQRLIELEQELEFNKENLQATIEQLETSNEELQATNEELLAANEELQSTNEELQSVNEELVTLNSEHQSKIRELTELNNDMNNLLANTEIGVIFLDEDLNIRKFTPTAQKIINLMPSDKGRPISHISHRFNEPISLYEEAGKVISQKTSMEREISSKDENGNTLYFLMKILPYKTFENGIRGVVISLVDISELKKMEILMTERFKFKSEILESINESIITTDHDFQIKSWNLYSEKLFGYTEEEAIGKNYFQLIHPDYSPEEAENLKKLVHEKGHVVRNSEFVHKHGRKIQLFTIKDLVKDKSSHDKETIIIICREV